MQHSTRNLLILPHSQKGQTFSSAFPSTKYFRNQYIDAEAYGRSNVMMESPSEPIRSEFFLWKGAPRLHTHSWLSSVVFDCRCDHKTHSSTCRWYTWYEFSYIASGVVRENACMVVWSYMNDWCCVPHAVCFSSVGLCVWHRLLTCRRQRLETRRKPRGVISSSQRFF